MNKESIKNLEYRLCELWNSLEYELEQKDHELFSDVIGLLKEFRVSTSSQEFVKED